MTTTNNKPAHTPGPLVARRKYFGSSDSFTPYVSDGDSSKVLFFMNLSGAYGGFKGVEQAEADAKLFAQAPDLLAERDQLKDQLAGEQHVSAAFKALYDSAKSDKAELLEALSDLLSDLDNGLGRRDHISYLRILVAKHTNAS